MMLACRRKNQMITFDDPLQMIISQKLIMLVKQLREGRDTNNPKGHQLMSQFQLCKPTNRVKGSGKTQPSIREPKEVYKYRLQCHFPIELGVRFPLNCVGYIILPKDSNFSPQYHLDKCRHYKNPL